MSWHLPQDITPTAATPSTPLGLWEPSLQESIIAAYNYREELDQLILDISIGTSQSQCVAWLPFSRFSASSTPQLSLRTEGQSGREFPWRTLIWTITRWSVDNTTALTASWRLFDGGRAQS